jgi:mannose-6-phosphate isomerase-like protein (cupin superfamily)
MERAEPLAGREIGGHGGDFVIVEWEDDGTLTSREQPVAPLHVHHADDEAWYVLEGTLGFRVGDREVEAPSGSAVLVPRGTPHTYWNARSEPTRYLLVMTPRIRQLVAALHDPDQREPVPAVFRRYESELV